MLTFDFMQKYLIKSKLQTWSDLGLSFANAKKNFVNILGVYFKQNQKSFENLETTLLVQYALQSSLLRVMPLSIWRWAIITCRSSSSSWYLSSLSEFFRCYCFLEHKKKNFDPDHLVHIFEEKFQFGSFFFDKSFGHVFWKRFRNLPWVFLTFWLFDIATMCFMDL